MSEKNSSVSLNQKRRHPYKERPLKAMHTAIEVKSKPYLKKLLKRNITKTFFEDLYFTALDGTNIILEVIGLPGTGKSTNAQIIAFILGKYMSAFNVLSKLRLGFGIDKTTQIVRKDAKPGDIILTDENMQLSGTGSETAKKALSNLLETIRQEMISFIFVSPEAKQVLPFKYYTIATWKKDTISGINTCKVYDGRTNMFLGIIMLNAGEFLRKQSRFVNYYEAKKTGNIARLKESGGIHSVKYDERYIIQDARQVLDFMRERGMTPRNMSDIAGFCPLAGVAGQSAYFKLVGRYGMAIYQGRGAFESSTEESNNIYHDTSINRRLPDNIEIKLVETGFSLFDNYKVLQHFVMLELAKHKIPKGVARIICSYFLWSKRHKRNDRYISPPAYRKIRTADIVEDWVDTLDPDNYCSPSTLYNSKGLYKKSYEGFKFTTKEEETIGESYLAQLLSNSWGREDTSLQAGPSLLREHGGLPIDVLLSKDGFPWLPWNHKLYSTGRRFPPEKLSDAFGMGILSPFKGIWLTRTRPFKEHVWINLPLNLLRLWRGEPWFKQLSTAKPIESTVQVHFKKMVGHPVWMWFEAALKNKGFELQPSELLLGLQKRSEGLLALEERRRALDSAGLALQPEDPSSAEKRKPKSSSLGTMCLQWLEIQSSEVLRTLLEKLSQVDKEDWIEYYIDNIEYLIKSAL